MTMIQMNSFAGEIPRLGIEQLPVTAAAIAENALLLSGELRGLHASRRTEDLTSTPYEIKRFFRIEENANSNIWVTFAEKNTHFLKGTLINDQWERYYWTEEGQKPAYNTLDRIKNSNDPYFLGVPRPLQAPVVVADDLGVGDILTRGYAYTFYSEYGEEGPPSEVTLQTGKPDDTWTISNMDITVPDAANRASFTKRLYRTITGAAGTAMFLVAADIPLAQDTYIDNSQDITVSLAVQLESWEWYEPPVTLEGIISHPNGFMVGFSGRDLYFSEPYRPHAYPPDYVVSTQYNIVGLGIFGTSVVVLTEGYPSIATGIHPSTMTMADSEFSEPCLSKYGIVNMPFGVYFPGPNGLMLVNNAGINNATKSIITKDEWVLRYFPKLLNAARWQDFYVAFYTQGDGFIMAPSEPQASFTQMGKGEWSQQGIQTDNQSGEVLLVDNNFIYTWNPPDGIPLAYRWRSKEYLTPKPINLGAYRIYWDPIVPSSGIDGDIKLRNAERMAYPLNTFNSHPYNSNDTIVLAPPLPKSFIKMPLGGSPLLSLNRVSIGNSILLRVFADGDKVYELNVPDNGMFRLPAGFKADRWTFELEGTATVKAARFAETGKELANA